MNAHTKHEGLMGKRRLLLCAIALVVVAVLVILQATVTGLSNRAMADGNQPIEAQLVEDDSFDMPLVFEHAYIVHEDQVIAEPATKVTVPRTAPFEFKAEADTNFQIESVKAIINNTEVTLTPNAEGLYKLTASEVLSTSRIEVRAIAAAAPIVEAVEGDEAEMPKAPAVAAPAAADTATPEASDAAAPDASDAASPAASATPQASSSSAASEAAASDSSASVSLSAQSAPEASKSAEAADAQAAAEPTLSAASVPEPDASQLAAASIPTETAITSDNAVVTVAVYPSAADRSAGTNPLSPEYEIGANETLYGAVHFDFHPGYGPRTGRLIYTYTLPSNIITADKPNATLYDDGGNVAGTWEISDNVVRFYYLESWALAHPNGGGAFNFDFTLDETQIQAGTQNQFSFPGASETITVNVKGHEISGTKTNAGVKDGVVTYTVKLNAEDGFASFVFSDHIEKNLHYVPGSFTIKHGNVTEALPVTITQNEDGTQDAVAAPRAIEEGTYTITYKATVDQAAFDAVLEGKKLDTDTTNTAKWEYNNEGEAPKVGTAFSTVSVSRDIISKSAPGGVTNGDHLQWKIKINPSSSMKTDVSNFTVTDTLKAGMKYAGSFKVLDANSKEIDSGTIAEGATSFTYTFPADAGAKKYYIVYDTIILDTTKVQDFTNYAEITPGGAKSTKTFHYEPNTDPGPDPAPEVTKVVADPSTVASDGIVSWHSTLVSDVYPEPEQESGLVLQYFDSVEQWNQTAGKPKPANERTNLEFVSGGNGTHDYYKIWIYSEPRLSAGGVPLVKGVDYQFDGRNDGNRRTYGFSSYGKNFAGETVPVSFRIRFILDSETMKSVVENKTPIEINYETKCDGTFQTYVNEGRARIVKGSTEVYGKSVEATYDLQGNDSVQKTGSMRWDADHGKYVASWEITANRGGGDAYVAELTSPYLTFRDSLPDGMRVIRDSISITALQPGEGSAATREYNVPFTLSQEGNVAVMTADLSKAAGEGSQPPFYNTESRTYGAWVKLNFQTELDSSAIVHDGTEQTLTNTATVVSGDIPLGSGRTHVYYTDSIVKKTGQQGNGEPVVHYTITVNELGQKLGLEEGQTEINLTDLLDYRTTVVLSSIKVADLKTGEDVTDLCTVTLSNNEKDAQNHTTSAFTVNVPDERALKITYDVKLSGNPGSSYDITNKATLEGITTNQSVYKKKFKVNHADASVYGSNTVISITKTDSSNVVDSSLRLQGAEFQLYLVDMSKLPAGSFTDEQLEAASTLVNTAITDESGSAVLYDENTRALQYDTLYYFKETVAPKGYAIDDTSPHFVMTQGSSYASQYALAASHGIYPTLNTTYNVTDTHKTNALLKARKVLQNGTLRDKAYSFELREGNKLIETAKNKADGTVSFKDIEYDAPGVHTYTIRELVPENANSMITYDQHVVTAVVTVVNDGEGSYVATAEYLGGGDEAVFTNVYNATANLSVKAVKNYEGAQTLFADKFSFALYEGDRLIEEKSNDADAKAEFSTLTYNSTAPAGDPHAFGKHTYRLIEKVPAGVDADNRTLKGVTYDVTERTFTVNVKQGADGAAVVTYENDDPSDDIVFANSQNGPTISATFTNSYEAKGSVVLEAKKTVNGGKPGDSGKYYFELYEGIIQEGESLEGKTQVGSTKMNDAAGNVVFDAIDYDTAGDRSYTIVEKHEGMVNPQGKYVLNGVTYDNEPVHVTVKVEDNGEGQLIATPTYRKGNANTNVFNNVLADDVELDLFATKVMDGRTFMGATASKPADRFTFELTGSAGAPMPGSADTVTKTIEPTDGTSAKVDFGKVKFGIGHIGHTYTYTVREVIPEQGSADLLSGVTYCESAQTITVEVVGKKDGTIGLNTSYSNGGADTGVIIKNLYDASGEAELHAVKMLEGRALKEGEFFFELTGGKGDVIPAAHNDADGNVTFKVGGFTQADAGKTYTYTISEVANNKLGGVTYDTASYDVQVTVSDNGDGTLGFSYDYGNAEPAPVFKNKYTVTPTSVQLTAHKALVGGTLKGGEFTFNLTGGPYDAETGQTAATTELSATNDAAGKVLFDAIKYDKAGTYRYEVSEVVPKDAAKNDDGTFTGIDGIIYDGTKHEAVVSVVDNGFGELIPTVAYDDPNGISFGNTAFAHKGFEFDKYLFGGVGTFDFTMTAADAQGNARAGQAADYSAKNVIIDDGASAFKATVSNGAFAGGVAKVVFPELGYTADGDYYYLIAEEESSTKDMVADEARYLAHVVVRDGEVESTTFDLIYHGENCGPTDDLSFYNNMAVTLGFNSLSAQSYTDFAERTSVYPKAKKHLNGKTDQLVGGEFAFELIDGQSGETVAVATNDEVGNIAFFDENTDSGLAFDEPGQWVYYIREVPGAEAGMIYDDNVVTVVVDVEQTADGLVATATYNAPLYDDEAQTVPVFNNVTEGMDITVQKVSRYGGEGLVDCTYALWMVGPAGDVMVKEAVSDESGYITFTDVTLLAGQRYYFKEVAAPEGHTVDPYRTAYFSLNAAGDGLVLVEETAADGWHSATENIEADKAKGASE